MIDGETYHEKTTNEVDAAPQQNVERIVEESRTEGQESQIVNPVAAHSTDADPEPSLASGHDDSENNAFASQLANLFDQLTSQNNIDRGMGFPVLKGRLSFSDTDGAWVWEGQWAMSKKTFALGDVSPFRYTRKLSSEGDAFTEATASSRPIVLTHGGGMFSGYFIVNDPNLKVSKTKIKVSERRVEFKFSETATKEGHLQVTGKGKNKFGPFELVGQWNKNTGEIEVMKGYLKKSPNPPKTASVRKKKISATPRVSKAKAKIGRTYTEPAIEATLRGTLTFDHRKSNWVWEGKWSLKTAHASPHALEDVQSFRYESSADSETEFVFATEDIEKFCRSTSTEYSGDFKYLSADKLLTAHDTIRMEFFGRDTTLDVEGGGSNIFGQFSIKGSFDTSTKQLNCTKAYKPMSVAVPKKTPASNRSKSRAHDVQNSVRSSSRSTRKVNKPNKYREPTPLEGNPLLQKCKSILDQMAGSSHSKIFRQPVDLCQFPEYQKFIETPMDLSTIRNKLLSGVYTEPHEFIADMQLIFSNSYTFNQNPADKVHQITKKLENVWTNKLKSLQVAIERKLNPQSKYKTPASKKSSSRKNAKSSKRKNKYVEEESESEEESDSSESSEESSDEDDSDSDSESDSDDSSDEEDKLKKRIKKLQRKAKLMAKKKKLKKMKAKQRKKRMKAKQRKVSSKKRPKPSSSSSKPSKKRSKSSTSTTTASSNSNTKKTRKPKVMIPIHYFDGQKIQKCTFR
jgi:hypothetical protein